MARAFLFVLDSFGIGGAPDAADFGDEGSDTLGHVRAACAAGDADLPGVRAGPLALANMASLGLFHAWALANGHQVPEGPAPRGFYGAAQETSLGKDTPSGHWEIAGVPVRFDWTHFPDTVPAFPATLTDEIVERAQLPGLLGNCRASGTEILDRLGAEHVATGKPIVYTSSDSVIQIAAHEESFGLDRLYALCGLVRELPDALNVGRVIARPFLGDAATGFRRSANRKDFSVPPPEATLLDRVYEAGNRVLAVGKIGDIFAHRGVSALRKAPDNMAMFDQALDAVAAAGEGDLVFANFVDFDTEYGHRRDPAGYAAALEAFDRRLPELFARMGPADMLILTADHGCDPTWRGTDHTRERVPIMGLLADGHPVPVGLRETFADIGETVARHLGLAPGRHGTSFRHLIADA